MQRHLLDVLSSAVWAICLALCLPFSSANAQGIGGSDIIGGGGGTPFDHSCPPGEFLVGLSSDSGQIVDGIGMVCARWFPLFSAGESATTGPSHPDKYFGG